MAQAGGVVGGGAIVPAVLGLRERTLAIERDSRFVQDNLQYLNQGTSLDDRELGASSAFYQDNI